MSPRRSPYLFALLFAALLFPAFSHAAALPEVPWPSKEVLGDLYPSLSEAHKEKLIKESLDEKYVAGVSYPSSVVFQHNFISVDKDGGQTNYYDYAVRINTQEAKRNFGEQASRYNSHRDSLDYLAVRVYLKDGRQVPTDPSTARTKDPFTDLVYSDLKVKTLTIQGLEEGAVLRMIVRKTHRPTVLKGFARSRVNLEGWLPEKETLHIVKFEAGMTISRMERINPPMPEMTEKVSTVAGETFYVYNVKNIKPRVPEPKSIPAGEFDNRILLATPATWSDVSRACTGLFEPKIAANTQAAEKAKELTSHLGGREEKIKAMYDFVKSFRYVGIFLTEGDFVPRPADETLKNGYGDCKDKAVLMAAMLRSIGIDSAVALVSTRNLLEEGQGMPSPFLFDHAIVALPRSNGAYMFLDPTGPVAPYGLLPAVDQYRHALVLGGKKSGLTLIPAGPPEKNWVKEKIKIELQDAQKAALFNSSDTISPNEWYHMIPHIPTDQLIQGFKQNISSKHKEVDVVSVRYEPANEQGVLKGEYSMVIGDFTKSMGNWHVFNPLADADKLEQDDAISLQTRITDIELDGPKRLTADVTVKIPASLTVEFVPKPLSVKNPKFGSYTYEVSQSPGTLKIKRDATITAKRVSVKDYAEFREFYRACLKQDEEMVGLKAK